MILDTNRKSFRTIRCPSCRGDHYGQVATEEGITVIHVLSARMVDKQMVSMQPGYITYVYNFS